MVEETISSEESVCFTAVLTERYNCVPPQT